MNAERFLVHYARIADAPEAISRLRRFILDLAVRGKLVPQDPTEEPASKLLKRIAAEKTRLVDIGEIKKSETVVDLTSTKPMLLPPHGWVITNLQSVCNSVTDGDHLPPPKAESGIPFLVIGNIRNQRIEFTGSRFVSQEYYRALDPIRRPRSGDLLYTLVGSYGIPVLVRDNRPFCVQRHIGILRPSGLIDVGFLARMMESQMVFDQAIACATGIAQKTVPLSGLRQLSIPLAPLAEQRRIVAKVDELMDLCSRLEAARGKREAVRDRLAAASLARLDAPDLASFQDDSTFALKALPALTARPDQIKQLRQTIINLAVCGKLVPQDSADGTGADLLATLGEARKNGAIDSRNRRTPAVDDISEEEQYLNLPTSWAWARVFHLGTTQTGTSPSSSNPDLFGDFVPFIKPADLDGDRINYGGPGLSEDGMKHSRVASENTVLMVCIGATLGKVNVTDRNICFNQQINSITPSLGGVHRFLALAFKASGFRKLAWSKAGTGTLPIISKGKWEILPIPIPPLSEQLRIVAKVDELMALCDRLETNLERTFTTRHRLLNAVLAEALVPPEHILAAAE
jgi:type I restriction enzyme S subunit